MRPENEQDLVEALTYAATHSEELTKQREVNYQKIIDKYTWDKVALRYVEYLRGIGGKDTKVL